MSAPRAGGASTGGAPTGGAPGGGAARGIARAAALILVITVLARVAGFLRYLVFGATVGGGDVGTAYASANMLPNVLFEVVAGGALAGCVIPLVAGMVEREGREQASRIVSALLGWTLLVTVPLAVAVLLLARPLAELILEGASSGATDLAARLLRVFAIQVPLYGVAVLLGAFLQARRRFLWPALAPLISSVVVMAAYTGYTLAAPTVATTATIGPVAEAMLGWGTTAGVLAMALPLVIPAHRSGLRLRPALRLPAGMGRRAAGLGAAGLGAVCAQQGALALILVLSMRAGGTGTLPVFQYAQAVYLLPYAVLVVPLITSVFPHLSELRLVGDTAAFSRAAATSLRTVTVVSAAGAAVLLAAAPAVEQFFRVVDRASVQGVGSCVGALALGLAPYAIATQCTRILSAALRARDALLVGSVGWAGAALLIAILVLSSPTRRTAEAATGFGLCIAAGMTLAALVGAGRLAELFPAGPERRAVYRTGAVSLLAFALGGTAGLLVCRLLVHGGMHVMLTVLLGMLAGLLALAVAGTVLLIGERRLVLGLRRRAPADPEPAR